MNTKRWFIGFLIFTLLLLLLPAAVTLWADPFFHYHAPLEQLSYPLDDQRHQNHGIVRHFSYDAVITGTSMTENFKASEFDTLFYAESVKVPFAGASYKEVNNVLAAALEANPDTRIILRGLDTNRILDHKDSMNFDSRLYPNYLYDDVWYNDVYYIFNKGVLIDYSYKALSWGRANIPGTTFDRYSYWGDDFPLGKEAILSYCSKPAGAPAAPVPFTDTDRQVLRDNFTQNVISLAQQYPDVQFYYFFTPYSIYWWNENMHDGQLDHYLAALTEASGMILEQENIHLFSFFEEYEMICNPDNYRDTIHYSAEISSQLLAWMAEDSHRLTQDNYREHWNRVGDFFRQYDYAHLYDLSVSS